MRRIAVISPFYNENRGLLLFLQSLDATFECLDTSVVFYLVDDGSTDNSADLIREYSATLAKHEICIVSLEFNAGHQMAIYEGIKKASENNFDNYLILDSDGQDDISIIPRLLEMTTNDVVWVQRSSRAEGVYFRIGYFIYQILYIIISARKIDFGNYSLISHKVARYLLLKRFVHYPTALLTSPFTKSLIKAKRLSRTYGKSKMSTSNLVHHAFLSFVEDSEVIVYFFLKCTFIIAIIFLLSIGNIFYQKYIAHTAILGWASVTSIGLFNLVFLSLGLFAISLSILKMGRGNEVRQEVKYEHLNKPSSAIDTNGSL